MKFKKIASYLLTAVLLANTPAAFGEVTQIGSDRQVCVSGNAGAAGALIAIEVFRGKLEDNVTQSSLLKLNRGEYLSLLVYHDQKTADENGDYSFDFGINTPSGSYSVYTATENELLKPEEFVYINNADFKTAVKAVNNAASVNAVADCIEAYPYELGLTDDDCKSVSVTGLASVIYNSTRTAPLDADSRDTAWKAVSRALLVQRLNENKITDIYAENPLVVGFDETVIKDWYKKSYVTDMLKADLNARLCSKGFADLGSYLNALADQFILATVQSPNGNDNVKDICTAFMGRIGIAAGDASADAWRRLAGQNFETLSGLSAEFAVLTNKKATAPGGGSGGKSFDPVVSVPPADLVKNTEIPKSIFTDIDDVKWAAEAITYLAERGIVNGYKNNTFMPNSSIKREEFVKLVADSFLKDSSETEISFNDVDLSMWYAPYLKKAYAEGVINGIENNLFGIGHDITRQDMCVIIYRAALKKGLEFDAYNGDKFGDDGLIADYAREAVYALKGCSAVNGVNESEFAPYDTASRAQAAKIIYTLIHNS